MKLSRRIIAAAALTLSLFPAGQTAAQSGSPASCDMAAPRIIERAMSAISAQAAPCGPGERAAMIEVRADRVCYETGLPETAQLSGIMDASRTIRVRRGTEVEEVEVSTAPSPTQIIDISRALDTVTLRVAGVMCVGADRLQMVSGTWRIHGSDAGSVFTGQGFFPSRQVGFQPDPDGTAQLRLRFELPEVQLRNDPAPRTISGLLTVPLR